MQIWIKKSFFSLLLIWPLLISATSLKPHMFGEVCLRFAANSDQLQADSQKALDRFLHKAQDVPVFAVSIGSRSSNMSDSLDERRFVVLKKYLQPFLEKIHQKTKHCNQPNRFGHVFCSSAIHPGKETHMQQGSCAADETQIFWYFSPDMDVHEQAKRLCPIPPPDPKWRTLFCTETACFCPP